MKGGIREKLGSEKWPAHWGKRKYQNLPANKNFPAFRQEQKLATIGNIQFPDLPVDVHSWRTSDLRS